MRRNKFVKNFFISIRPRGQKISGPGPDEQN